jgi:hypothetical protein
MMMQRIMKQKDANKRCIQKFDKNSKNSNTRTSPTHVQTRTQKCKVKENHFLKPQNSRQRSKINANLQQGQRVQECTQGIKIFTKRIRVRNSTKRLDATYAIPKSMKRTPKENK